MSAVKKTGSAAKKAPAKKAPAKKSSAKKTTQPRKASSTARKTAKKR